jgi:tRNA pseudouridine38-40 synthase
MNHEKNGKRSIEATSYEPAGRLLLEISFDGTDYRGWQIQPHSPSVQAVLQRKLTAFYDRQPIHLIGSSRTDGGVHALGFAASFLVPVHPVIPADRLRIALNRQLPPAIRVRTIREVPLDFHSRYDALGKAYTYVINLGEETPFSARFSWHPRRPLDLDALAAAARRLTGKHDFSSFVVERNQIDDAVRTIFRIEPEVFGQYLCITYLGDGFLYKMIRCLTGTLEAAGAGKLTPDAVQAILEACDRTRAAETAPPHGLFLDKVFYDQAEMDAFRLTGVPFFQ